MGSLGAYAGTNNSTIVFPMPMELGEILANMVAKKNKNFLAKDLLCMQHTFMIELSF